MSNTLMDQWREHIKTQRSSGLSKAEYCRQSGLKCHQFLYWEKRQIRDAVRTGLIPITVSSHSQLPQTYCTIEYAHGIRLNIQSKEVLGMLPQLLMRGQ